MTRDDSDAEQVEALRLAIYHAFADDGRAPVPDVLARQLGLPPAEIDADLHALARHATSSWAPTNGCSWRTRSRRSRSASPSWAARRSGGAAARGTLRPSPSASGERRARRDAVPGLRSCACVVRRADAPPPGQQVAHFLVPAAHMWDDVVHTCGNQRLFCWRRVSSLAPATGNERGYVMDLATLWRLASAGTRAASTRLRPSGPVGGGRLLPERWAEGPVLGVMTHAPA